MNMAEEMKSKMGMSDEQMRSVKGQLKQLDEDMKKATTQAAKDEIKQRQDELNRQLKGMEMR
jgi:hypothetical protein